MQADDIALLSSNKHDMDAMMKICHDYSLKWRYSLNPSKSVVMVFGETQKAQKRLQHLRKWTLGGIPVQESTTHRHVGILLSSIMQNTERTVLASRKIRNAFFAVIGTGLHPSNVNPLTILKAFQSICIPRGLFGSELWCNMTSKEYNILETTQRFCVKYIQNFHKRTKTDIALASLGIANIRSQIDKNKLFFLRRLCYAPNHARVKQLFLHRLMSFQRKSPHKRYGFIPEIYSILQKYDLTHVISNYINTGIFPKRLIWKKIVLKAVNSFHQTNYSQRAQDTTVMRRFITIHQNCSQPLLLWKATKKHPVCLKQLSYLAKLCTITQKETLCSLCGKIISDIVVHVFCFCTAINDHRIRFWDNVITKYDISLEVELHNMSDEQFVCTIMGAKTRFFEKNENAHYEFLKNCAIFWHDIVVNIISDYCFYDKACLQRHTDVSDS